MKINHNKTTRVDIDIKTKNTSMISFSSNYYRHLTYKWIGRVIFILICIELILQLFAFAKYIISLRSYRKISASQTNNWYLGQKSNQWWLTQKSATVYHPLLGFITKNIKSPNLNVDENGIRNTTYRLPNQQTTPITNIFFFGNSTMFGNAVKDNETIPSYFANSFNNDNSNIQISNYGQLAYTSNQSLSFFIMQLKKGNIPDTVIFYDGCNDLYASNSQKGFQNIYNEQYLVNKIGNFFTFEFEHPDNTSLINPELIAKFVNSYLKIIHYPKQLISSIRQTTFENTETDKYMLNQDSSTILSKDIADNYIENSKLISSLADQFHFRYYLFWQPLAFNKKLTPKEQNSADYTKQDITIYQQIIDRINKSGISNFHDLTQVFDKSESQTIFYDKCHISPKGNEIVANKMSQIVNNLENRN
jgi:lysophospholipase L1-like esterase